MKFCVVCIFDRAANVFGRPAFVASIGLAVRSFQDEVNRSASDNDVFKHPEDFDLMDLGYYNDENGYFETHDRALLIGHASQYKIVK